MPKANSISREGKRPSRRVMVQKLAFGIIKSLSVLTIVVLTLIIGFIVYKGLRYSGETRSTVLPYEEAQPDGLVVIANPDTALERIEYPVLYGIFTDEYINWSKIDAQDEDLRPFAIDPKAEGGAAAQDLVFGAGAEALGTLAWGGLTEFLPSAQAVVSKVAATPGSIAVVPAAVLAGRADLKTIALRRISVAANADATALVENQQIEALPDLELANLGAGKTADWSAVGGPSLAVKPLAPPPGSSLAAVLKEAKVTVSGPAEADMEAYLAAIAETSGALGYAFAEDLQARGLSPLVHKGRESGWNLKPSYLWEAPRLSGRVGGISTIIANTFFMLLLTLLFAAPLGVAAAVYLVEYARQGPLVRILRLGTETLAGIPSIIFGLFGMLFFVNILHFGFGLLSGCLTLTLMILPTIVRTSEEALKSVPRALREGSLALGATKLQTIAKVVIPAAAPGILTGLILAIGRAVGETAALIFTMGSDYKLAHGLFSSARVLAAHVYIIFAEGISFDRAFSTATVLIVIVLGFNFAAKRLVGRMSRNAAS